MNISIWCYDKVEKNNEENKKQFKNIFLLRFIVSHNCDACVEY